MAEQGYWRIKKHTIKDDMRERPTDFPYGLHSSAMQI